MLKRRYRGFDYEAVNHPDLERPTPKPAAEGEWIHVGGGWYENTATGERQKGRPVG